MMQTMLKRNVRFALNALATGGARYASSSSGLKQVQESRKLYEVSTDTRVKGVPMLDPSKPPPIGELPKPKWIKMVVSTLSELLKEEHRGEVAIHLEKLKDHVENHSRSGRWLKSIENHVEDVLHSLKNVFTSLFNNPAALAEMIASMGMPQEHATSLSEYDLLFPKGNPSTQPETLHELDNDFAFARLRTAGYAPMQLRPLDENHPDKALADAAKKVWKDFGLDQYKGASKTLKADALKAKKEGRLFYVSYAMFKDVPGGSPGGFQKYPPSPVALFEVPKDDALAKRAGVTVLAIQLSVGDVGTIFTPADALWAWRYAKLMFNGAEGNWHEGVLHLGDTHLVVEAACLSMHRSLPKTHPVYVLMKEHFQGTLLINWLANAALIQPGGSVDNLLSASIESVNAIVSEQVLAALNEDLSYPALLKRNGLSEEQTKTLKSYPFRDDASKHWIALKKWVTAYIDASYKSDADVNADLYLRGFRKEMIEEGKIGWVEREWPEGRGSKTFLVELLTSVIFRGSVQHASVNFPQRTMMGSVTEVPLGNYSKVLTPEQATEETVMAALPPLSRASEQKLVLELLGGVYYTTLGEYSSALPKKSAKVQRALQTFKNDLKQIGKDIEARNIALVRQWEAQPAEVPKPFAQHWAYETLLPKRIPQSINI